MSNVIQFLSHALIQVGDYLVVECPFSTKKKIEIKFTYNSFWPEEYNWKLSHSQQLKSKILFQMKDDRFEIEAHGAWFFCNGIAVQKTILTHNMCVEFEGLKLKFTKKNSDKKGVVNVDENLTNSSLNILFEGETGTGKTSMAKNIHDASRISGLFLHLNLAAIPFGLIESTLFGHKKGAFTGAIQDEKGAIEKAKNGTLFLDELDSIPHSIQLKLLLMLDNHFYYRVGESNPRRVECRFFFSTGKPLKELVKNNHWRKDFYYRILTGHHVVLPSLREKPELVHDFISQFKQEKGIEIDPFLEKFYLNCSWEGNYRQLSSHFERKKLMSSRLYWKYDDLDDELLSSESIVTDEAWPKLEKVKQDYVYKVLHRVSGKVSEASRILGISELTIRRMKSA